MADLQSQLDRINRRRKLAEAMGSNAMRPIDPMRSSGRYVTPISPFEGLAQVASAALAGRSLKNLDKEEETARTSASERMAKALGMAAGIGGAEPAAALSQRPEPPKQPMESTVLPPAAAAAEGDLLASQIRQPAQNAPMEAPPVEVSGSRPPAKPQLPTAQAYMAQLNQVSQQTGVPLQELLASPLVQMNLKQIEELNKPQKLGEEDVVFSPQYGTIAEGPKKMTDFGRLHQEMNSGELNAAEVDSYRAKIAKDAGIAPQNVQIDPATGKAWGVVFENGQPAFKEIGGGMTPKPEYEEVFDPTSPSQTRLVPKADASGMPGSAKIKATSINQSVNTGPDTPGRKKADELFADEYVQFKAAGGYADISKQLNQLREISKKLGNKELTGPITGRTPDFINEVVNPEAIAAREAVQEVAQRNLRVVLGPQFTAKEGEALIERVYNPRLSEQENQKRVDRLIQQIEGAAKAKQEAADYFEKNGTLTGWNGKRYTISDFDPDARDSGLSPGVDDLLKKYGQ